MKIKPEPERHFIALDGEAINTPDGRHLYVLLCASDGSYAYNPKGLSTVQCFNFLLELRRRHPNTIFAGFSFNYDVNMMLRDLRPNTIRRLWDTKRSRWYREGRAFRLEWLPGKTFTLGEPETNTSLRVNDVFGFYQCSFVKALEAWKIGAPETIARMKGERSNFTLEQIDEIRAYCFEECRLLVELLEELDAALQAAGLRPSQWCGAGSIAAAMLRREGVKRYMPEHESYPDDVNRAVLSAYFGGRIEVFQQGEFENVYAYDLRSAYPAAATVLPDGRGTWRRNIDLEPWSIYRVAWRVPNDTFVCPFPYRRKGMIYYPVDGEGWYWEPEVRAAINLYGDAIRILDGWTFTPETDAKPFAFIPRVYAERAQAKRDGHAKNVVLKLGLNATYGKLAQGYGYQGKAPAFRSFFWAGNITSATRARLLQLAAIDPAAIVSFATDGVLTTRELEEIIPADELGAWELTYLNDLFVAQPGVYTATVNDGKEILKSRGFFSSELDFDQIRQGWKDKGTSYVYVSNKSRFFGIGTALAWNDLSLRGTWRPVERKLSLTPGRKFALETNRKLGRTINSRKKEHITIVQRNIRLLPPWRDEEVISEEYVPKSTGLDITDDAAVEFLQGLEQPSSPLPFE